MEGGLFRELLCSLGKGKVVRFEKIRQNQEISLRYRMLNLTNHWKWVKRKGMQKVMVDFQVLS